jgi:hypothetical protein
MNKTWLIVIALGAAGAYALSRYGRAAVAGAAAGEAGDQVAKDLAASMSFVDGLNAGVRSLLGMKLSATSLGFTPYVVTESKPVKSPTAVHLS